MNERQQLNDFQKEVNTTVESFWQAAQAKRGRVMGSREVMHVATYISGLTSGIMDLENRLAVSANMLAAYINEYGSALADELLTDNVDVVEGEVVDAVEANGSDDEGAGVALSAEGEVARPLSEDI